MPVTESGRRLRQIPAVVLLTARQVDAETGMRRVTDGMGRCPRRGGKESIFSVLAWTFSR